MILSRTLARKRIAAGKRPSFGEAWGLVAADIVLIGILLWVIWQPALSFVYLMQFSLLGTILFLMAVIFVPLQTVIVISTIWAVRSRWQEKETDTA
ncbi:hypothetical protein [Yoonia sp.]|uniref:hypothetical protein n=1 Tax=Yoonia sp. TaxID=2212373 RepID=UPI0019F1222A|nr:hypothetical protein [Yoonia sp.]MBE0412266.1 hypothetical protein [Yoonia sp.]